MLPKYEIEYVIHPHHAKRVDTHSTNDPVEAEDFLMGLLSIGAGIRLIKHDGIELEGSKADQMYRIAADRLASRLLCNSLGLDSAQVNHRFGFAA